MGQVCRFLAVFTILIKISRSKLLKTCNSYT